MATESAPNHTGRSTLFPLPTSLDRPQADEVLSDLLAAAEVVLRHPEPVLQALAAAQRPLDSAGDAPAPERNKQSPSKH
jgi:hypothetical protein